MGEGGWPKCLACQRRSLRDDSRSSCRVRLDNRSELGQAVRLAHCWPLRFDRAGSYCRRGASPSSLVLFRPPRGWQERPVDLSLLTPPNTAFVEAGLGRLVHGGQQLPPPFANCSNALACCSSSSA